MSILIRSFSAQRFNQLLTLSAAAMLFLLVIPTVSLGQKPRGGDGDEAAPAFSEFKGVRLGMTADEARKKLGNPRDKGADQDFYMMNDNEAVQVYYDKKGAVSAISVDYLSGASGIPAPKDVLGTAAEAKADGSIYKMIRYPKAGYWVSYSRTSGDAPTITVTIQRIDH